MMVHPWFRRLSRYSSNVPLYLMMVAPFVAITVGTVTLVGYLSYRSGQEAVTQLANQVMDATSSRIHDRLDTYLQTSQQVVRLNQQALEQGTLNINNSAQLERYFFQQVQSISNLTSIQFSSVTGRDVIVLRDRNGVASPAHSLLVSSSTTSPQNRPFYRTDQQGNRLEIVHTVSNFDPRLQPWYRIAVQAQQQTWTPVYAWLSVPLASITTAVPIYQNGQLQGVLNADVLLSDMNLFLRTLHFSPSGQAFIIERSGDLVATSTPEQAFVQTSDDKTLIRRQAINSQDLTTKTAAQTLFQQRTDLRHITGVQHLTFQVKGQRQLMQVTPYQDRQGLDWLVVTVIPESDFMEQILVNQTRTMVLCGLLLFAAIRLGTFMARQLSKPILKLSQASQDLAQGEWQQPLSEDIPIAELKTLTRSFNQTSEQLQQFFERIKVALEESEEKFTTVFRISPDPIAITDLTEGRFLEANNRMLEFLGYSRAELIGLTARDLNLWVDSEERKQFRHQLETQGYVYQEIITRIKSGETKIVLLSAEVCQLQGQNAIILTLRDISDRKHAEQTLRESEERLRIALEAAQMGSWDWNIVTNQIIWSDNMEQIMGIQPGTFDGRFETIVSMLYPDDRERVLTALTRSVEQGDDYDMEFRFVKPDGSIRWAASKGNVLRDAAGRPVRMAGIDLDITDRKLAEAALRQSEARFQEIARTVSQLFFVRSATTGEFIYISPAYEQIWQRSCESLYEAPQSWAASIHPDDRNQVQALMSLKLQGKSVRMEYRIVRPNGTIRWISAEVSVIQDATGNPLRFVGLVEDITDRRVGEIALEQESLRRKTLFDHSFDGIVVLDHAGQVIEANASFANMLGYSLTEISTLKLVDFDAQWTAAELQQMIEDRSCNTIFETRHRRKDGSIYDVEISSNCVEWNGQSVHFCICRDISQRKRAEAELQNAYTELERYKQQLEKTNYDLQLTLEEFSVIQEEVQRQNAQLTIANQVANAERRRYQDLFDRAPDGYAVTDARGIIQEANQALAILLQKPQPVLLGKPLVIYFAQSSRRQCVNLFAEFQQQPQSSPQEFEFSLRLSKEDSFPVIVTVAPIYNAQQVFLGTRWSLHDIRDRKQAELALQQAKEAAEAANLAKSTFLANMSHELRTPLNVILGYTQLLSHDITLIPEYQDYLRSIQRSGNHLLALINSVLDLSKIEAGCLTLDESQFELPELLQLLREMFRLRAEAKGLKLVFERSADLPQFITADLNKLRQVMINLLNNAVKFTETGTITLRVHLGEREQSGPRLRRQRHTEAQEPEKPAQSTTPILSVEVEDTGVGIAPKELTTIFEAFAQGSAGRLSTEGTGLGLAISQRFVQLMGGELYARSSLGQGSQFSFWIPIDLVTPTEVIPTVPDRSIVGVLPGQPRYRVLVVDDQHTNRQLLVHFLKKVELDVQEACSGAEAIQKWQDWQPHLIWMDIRMSEMSGYEAMQQIRRLEQQSSQTTSPLSPAPAAPVPIVAITAQAYQQDREQALAAGFTEFIAKPFEAAAIFQQLTLHLGLQYQYADTASRSEAEIANSRPPMLQPDALQIMPAEWIAALHRASLNCSSQEVESLIAQIPPQHMLLAKTLKQLVYNYDFEALMRLSHA